MGFIVISSTPSYLPKTFFCAVACQLSSRDAFSLSLTCREMFELVWGARARMLLGDEAVERILTRDSVKMISLKSSICILICKLSERVFHFPKYQEAFSNANQDLIQGIELEIAKRIFESIQFFGQIPSASTEETTDISHFYLLPPEVQVLALENLSATDIHSYGATCTKAHEVVTTHCFAWFNKAKECMGNVLMNRLLKIKIFPALKMSRAFCKLRNDYFALCMPHNSKNNVELKNSLNDVHPHLLNALKTEVKIAAENGDRVAQYMYGTSLVWEANNPDGQRYKFLQASANQGYGPAIDAVDMLTSFGALSNI